MKLLPLLNLALATVALSTVATSPAQARDEWVNLGATPDGIVTLNVTQTKAVENDSLVFFVVYGLIDVRFNSNSQPQVAGITILNSGINCRTRQAKLLSLTNDRGEQREYDGNWFTPGQQTPEALVLSQVCR